MRDILSCKNFSPLPIRLCGRIQIFLFTSKIFCPRCATETWKKVSVGGHRVSRPPTPPIQGPSVCSAQQGREIAKHPHRGNAPSMETRPAGECSRSRDDLTLPKSSGSGSELMTQWRPPQRPIERQIMKLYSRDKSPLDCKTEEELVALLSQMSNAQIYDWLLAITLLIIRGKIRLN